MRRETVLSMHWEIGFYTERVFLIRQRICLLKDCTDKPFAEIRQGLRDLLCNDTYVMTENDIRKVEEIEKEYLDETFIGIKRE